MAKRSQSIKEFERSMKKPKLDININKSRQTAKVDCAHLKTFNFWDDDDDDVILLASQIAETAIPAPTEKPMRVNEATIATKIPNNQCRLTFSEFFNAGATSTQKSLETPPVKSKILSQLVDDNKGVSQLLPALEKEDLATFTVPSISTAELQGCQKPKEKGIDEELTEFVLSQNSITGITQSSLQNAASRRQLATERQLKFLMDKVNALKKENTKLSKSLLENKETMESQAGECAILRDELRDLQQQLQNSKMEKMLHVETTKNECQTKIAELSKKIVATQTELRLRQVECLKMKTKHADETRRLYQSVYHESFQEVSTKELPSSHTISKDSRQFNKWLFKMRNLDVAPYSDSKDSFHTSVLPNFYETAREKNSLKKQQTIFQIQLKNIQVLMAQLAQLVGLKRVPENFLPKCINSTFTVLYEFWSYCHSLEYSKNDCTLPYHNITRINVTSEATCKLRRGMSLLEPIELYEKEKAISLRRYISALMIICREVPNLSLELLQCKQNEYYLLQILIDALSKLGYARDITEHFGVLEALAGLLHTIVKNVPVDLNIVYVKLIVNTLKQIIFTRPNFWVLLDVSSTLLLCCKRLPQAVDFMCVSSGKLTFLIDRIGLTSRFTNSSCLIQVYSGLLDVAFPTISKLNIEHFRLLINICSNHIHFAYHCFTNASNFVKKHLHSYNSSDEDDDDHENGNGDINTHHTHLKSQLTDIDAKVICKCYMKLCLSVVALTSQMLKQWLLHQREHFTRRVGNISRIAIHLIYLMFCDNYSSGLLCDFEEIAKHHLQFICKWLSRDSKILEFKEIHLNFLKGMQNAHIMSNYVSLQSNINNIMVDLLEWKELFKFDDDRVIPCTEEEANVVANNLIFQGNVPSKVFTNCLK